MDDNIEPRSSRRGFALMSPERRLEIARKGGRSVPPEKRSFSQNRQLAVAAGSKGGASVKGHLRAYSKDRDLASAAGRKGGLKTAMRTEAAESEEEEP